MLPFGIIILFRKHKLNTKIGCAVLALCTLSACAIHQTVKPVERFSGKTVCIVENPAVKNTFLQAYSDALTIRGYTVRQLPADASLITCPITSTYTANWRWDIAMYMVSADITVYNNGRPSGKANYDSKRAGLNTNKFINAEKKIAELVGQLFPD
jgi:hypothetical protein